MQNIKNAVCFKVRDAGVLPGHRHHWLSWWGRSCRARSVLTGPASSTHWSTGHTFYPGSGAGRDTDRSRVHTRLTWSHLENRNTLENRVKAILVRPQESDS